MEDLKSEELEYVTVGKFLMNLKKKSGRGDNKIMKIAELKKVKQRNRTIEEFVQEFKQVAKDNGSED